MRIGCWVGLMMARPAAVRHGSPCAVLFRAVPERSGLNQQVRFVQTDRTAAGGFQKERTAGKRHGTIADAGPCAHRKAAALHRRSAAQAAVRPGYGDLAAFIHRNAAAVGRFFHIADLQRTINFCTAAGDCLGATLYDLLRRLYRQSGGNEDLFATEAVDFDAGAVDAALLRSRGAYMRALTEADELPHLSSDALTTLPGIGQSAAQVIHNVDERAGK